MIGVGTTDYLNELLAAPLLTFTFSGAGASVYQLMQYSVLKMDQF